MVKDRRPVVVTGAMRPSTGMGTDSDINLLDCIRVAAAPQSGGRGVLTVLNHEIQTARDVTKINSHRLETFRSRKLGSLGYAESDEQVVFYRSPAKSHAVDSEFDVTAVEQRRRVGLGLSLLGSPPEWAIGHTFEFTFCLPAPLTGRPGLKSKRKTVKPKTAKSPTGTIPSKPSKKTASTKTLMTSEAKAEARRKYDQTRNQTPTRGEGQRRKALSLCVDCASPPVPGETRCRT